jgi:UDP-N-acetyl-D-mannosaminuronic acid transferase (WecB/TagA/CpsF family)
LKRTELIGFPFDAVTQRSVVERCIAWCTGRREPHTVITVNASHLCMMRRDTKLDQACRAGDLIVADGMSVVWAARLAASLASISCRDYSRARPNIACECISWAQSPRW